MHRENRRSPIKLLADMTIDSDSIELAMDGMNLVDAQENLTNWTRSGKEVTTVDAAVIQQVLTEAAPEPDDNDMAFLDDDDDEDDTYINHGVVAPVEAIDQCHILIFVSGFVKYLINYY
jgi:hypothetical protein